MTRKNQQRSTLPFRGNVVRAKRVSDPAGDRVAIQGKVRSLTALWHAYSLELETMRAKFVHLDGLDQRGMGYEIAACERAVREIPEMIRELSEDLVRLKQQFDDGLALAQ